MNSGVVRVGEIDIPYRFSPRAKLLTVRITRLNTPELVIPQRISLKRALSFLEGKLGWLTENLPPRIEKKKFEHGAEIPVLGEILRLNHNVNAAGLTHINCEFIEAYGAAHKLEANVRSMLNNLLLKKTAEIANHKAAMLGVGLASLQVKHLESMWGNCSRKRIVIASSLVHAPLPALEYVISHEVAHLKEMNHSKKFWMHVEQLMPDYEHHRKWLKSNQASLGAWAG